MIHRFDFQPLGEPFASGRPAVPVRIDGFSLGSFLCLVDTGAFRTRLPGWVAGEIGLAPEHGAPLARVALGGGVFDCWQEHVVLEIGALVLPCSVWFCDGWTSSFGLLGQEDVLMSLRLLLSARHEYLELEPEDEMA